MEPRVQSFSRGELAGRIELITRKRESLLTMQRLFIPSRSLLPRLAQSAQKKQPCRKLSGHGGHSAAGHHKAEPYAAKHGEAYTEEAYAFGIKPGAPLEGWEIPVYGVLFATSIVLFVSMGIAKEDTSFTVRRSFIRLLTM